MSAKRTFCGFLIASAAGVALTSAIAQEFPNKPLRYVVPNGPGILTDLVARVMAPEMSNVLGQPVIVENKPGAAEAIGYEYVAKQMPADGHTMVIAAISSLAILPLTTKELRVDTLRELPPVMNLVEGRYIFGVSATTPFKTFGEFAAYAKANPKKINFGGGNPTVLFMKEALMRDVGAEVTFVAYKEGARYVQALATGEVQAGFLGEGSAVGLGDKYRILALTGDRRSPNLKDVPTFRELGHPQINGLSYSLNVRAGTPKAAMDRLHAAASAALAQPIVKAATSKLQLDIIPSTPEAAANLLQEQARLFADIARKTGIKPE